MLEFAAKEIKGTHGPVMAGSPELHVRRVKYWDVRGEGEVRGESGGRSLAVLLILHDGHEKLADFEKALEQLDDLVGKHGTLKETGDLKRTWKNVTFEGYDPVPLEGQEQPGPILDVGVLTRTKANGDEEPDEGYFAQYLLRFRQLKP